MFFSLTGKIKDLTKGKTEMFKIDLLTIELFPYGPVHVRSPRIKVNAKKVIFMLKYERKQGNRELEHMFGLTFFFAFWSFLAIYGLGQKNPFFKNQISNNYFVT